MLKLVDKERLATKRLISGLDVECFANIACNPMHSGKVSRLTASLLLGVLAGAFALLFFAPGSEAAPQAEAQGASRPNFVYVLADDMRKDDLKHMPKTRKLLGSQGMTFENAFVPYGLCCPSRASILTGMYAHNHKVWTNGDGANGGWEGWRAQGHEKGPNMAKVMRDGGYRTGLFGKYFNGYDGSAVPPGWDDFFGRFKGHYFDWSANDNGQIRRYGSTAGDYETDEIGRQTRQFVDQSVRTGKPFMAYVTPPAPHCPCVPAPRHRGTIAAADLPPKPPSFNERDVSDKPSFNQRPFLTSTEAREVDKDRRVRAELLLALDGLIEDVVNKLEADGVLENTYVVFTSDNGWMQGEHRFPSGKANAYEESIRMPLLVRGPGVAAGSTTDKIALNTDIFPTFADLGGVTIPKRGDGRSLAPVLRGTASSWREAFLMERRDPAKPWRSFFGIRSTEPRKYVEYEGGEKELYDLVVDPYELENLHQSGSKAPADLKKRLDVLKTCTAETCRAAEGE